MSAQKAYQLLKALVENGAEIRSRIRRHAKDWVARSFPADRIAFPAS